MQAGPTQGRCEVIENHRLGAALGLGALPRVIDDEGVDVGHGPQCPFGVALLGEAQPLAGQPLQVAVLAHMAHQLHAGHLAQPQVLRQVQVGGGQVRGVIAEAGIAVVAALGLNQQAQVAEAQPLNGEPGGAEARIVGGWAPTLLQLLAPWLWQLGIPLLIDRQGQMGERRAVATFRVVGAARQQQLNQGVPIAG